MAGRPHEPPRLRAETGPPGTLNTLGLKAIEARLEGLLEQAAIPIKLHSGAIPGLDD